MISGTPISGETISGTPRAFQAADNLIVTNIGLGLLPGSSIEGGNCGVNRGRVVGCTVAPVYYDGTNWRIG